MASPYQRRRAHLARLAHLRSMRMCWPDWEGPRVEDSVHGRCSVGSCCVFSLTHGDTRYQYMAPCVIEEVHEDGTVIARVDYGPDAPQHCRDENGEILRLEAEEVWPPTDELWAMRHAAEVAEAIAAGTPCPGCGSKELAHIYGGRPHCQACIDAARADLDARLAASRRPKRKKAAKKAARKKAKPRKP